MRWDSPVLFVPCVQTNLNLHGVKLSGNFRASDEEESWNHELNTSLTENGEIGCGAVMRWVCVLIMGRR